ncbi:MAG: pilus assembly protein TadG-related protein [Pseudomonadota bacterium]
MVNAALTNPVHASLTLSGIKQRQARQQLGLGMIRQAFNRLWNDKRGNALIIMGAALPLVVGSAGLATDTIQWTLWKRQLQRAADSAAIAGVYATVQRQTVSSAVDTDVYANKTVSTKLKNANILLTATPLIAYPPATPSYNNAVQVTLAMSKSLAFSSMFMSAPPVITAAATAATIETGTYCVVSLESTNATGINLSGNGSVNLGCGMITNSLSLDAAIATGSSSVTATPIAAVGGVEASDNWGSAQLLPFTIAQADPFADVYPETTNCPGTNFRVNANESANRLSDTGTVCFSSMTLNGDVQLGSATYVIDAGDLSVGSTANVRCTGCTIVLTSRTAATNPNSIGSVTMTGGPQLNMSAPTTGPYKGLLFYQDRRALSGTNEVNKINGSATSTLAGAFYFPSQQLDLNGTAKLNLTCGQFVARNVSFSGNGGIENSCLAGYGDGSILGRHVRLVG